MRQKINKRKNLLKGNAVNQLIQLYKRAQNKTLFNIHNQTDASEFGAKAFKIIEETNDELKLARLEKRKDVTGKILYVQLLETTKLEHVVKKKPVLIERAISSLSYEDLLKYQEKMNKDHSGIAKNMVSWLIRGFERANKIFDKYSDLPYENLNHYLRVHWGNNVYKALQWDNMKNHLEKNFKNK